MPFDFDVVVVGAGSAGFSAVEGAIAAGAKKVALVEASARLGGECPNWGCVPSKAILRSAEVFSLMKRAAEFGIQAPRPKIDFRRVHIRMRETIDALSKPPRLENYLASLKVKLLRGTARFENARTLSVSGKIITAKKFIICTGSTTFVPDITGLDKVPYWTAEDLLEMKKLPPSIVIIGGGPIGVETAQYLNAFGVACTIIESASHLVAREDEEIAAILTESFKRRGIRIFTGAKINAVDRRGQKIIVSLAGAAVSAGKKPAPRSLEAEAILLATGKQPNLGFLHLEKAGVKFNERGWPILNEYLQGSPSVYLAGDATGQMFFTHVSHYQGDITGRNAAVGNKIKNNLRVVPRGTYVSPEIGSVGMTEAQAIAKKIKIAVGRAPYSAFGKSLVAGEEEMTGLVKIIVDKKTKQILGGHAVGAQASEIIHEIAMAMYANIPYTSVGQMIHAYPTYAEAVGAACSEIV
ncbi:MAG: NAD(P)/FAD-dependent oxidoreductase [Candidatus Magasanikbacteria bacterium]|nr:NAD(P)/FAD-dependent oxidoreductase [Candidatus Magasanikbacteria bacterium]